MLIHTDCREYRADRPCRPHKETGAECEDCPVYDPVRHHILIIKLGAMGDVLRTTALLEPLRRARPGCSIEWMTRPESVDLLKGVVDRILVPESATLAEIQVREYDLVINLDLSRDSAALASYAKARDRRGYIMSKDGAVVPCDERGRTWYEMSLHDGLKKANQRTYQDHMLDILGLEPPIGEILIRLDDADRQAAQKIMNTHHLEKHKPIIGFNIGAGGRWRWKAWTTEGFIQLARLLNPQWEPYILLLYGPEEASLKDSIMKSKGSIRFIDTRGDNPIRQFMGLIELCDLVVTGDTLAMHIALGLGKQVVGLFGPTSMAEIEMYGRGVKLAGEVTCLCCYRNDCDVRPSCMQTLKAETVFKAVEERLEILAKHQEESRP